MNRKVMLLVLGIILSFLASPKLAESGDISIGVYGGYAGNIAGEAVEGFSETEFKGSGVYGGSIMYRFSKGFALEINGSHLEMDLEEKGEKFGTLKMTPVLLLLKYQGMPKSGKGFTGHAEIGGGVNLTSFSKGPFITDLERTSRNQLNVETDNDFIFALGGGVDYFFTKNVSVNLDVRFLLGNVGTSWKVSGFGRTSNLTDIDTFHISNIQGLLGLRVWF